MSPARSGLAPEGTAMSPALTCLVSSCMALALMPRLWSGDPDFQRLIGAVSEVHPDARPTPGSAHAGVWGAAHSLIDAVLSGDVNARENAHLGLRMALGEIAIRQAQRHYTSWRNSVG